MTSFGKVARSDSNLALGNSLNCLEMMGFPPLVTIEADKTTILDLLAFEIVDKSNRDRCLVKGFTDSGQPVEK